MNINKQTLPYNLKVHGLLEMVSVEFWNQKEKPYPLTSSFVLLCRIQLVLLYHIHLSYPVFPFPGLSLYLPGLVISYIMFYLFQLLSYELMQYTKDNENNKYMKCWIG